MLFGRKRRQREDYRRAPFALGDPDPTPGLNHRRPWCAEVSPSGSWSCTWEKGHTSPQHIAGDGRTIVAIW